MPIKIIMSPTAKLCPIIDRPPMIPLKERRETREYISHC